MSCMIFVNNIIDLGSTIYIQAAEGNYEEYISSLDRWKLWSRRFKKNKYPIKNHCLGNPTESALSTGRFPLSVDHCMKLYRQLDATQLTSVGVWSAKLTVEVSIWKYVNVTETITLRSRQNGRHLIRDISKWIFSENVQNFDEILPKLILMIPFVNTDSLVKMMACHWTGHNLNQWSPHLLVHICAMPPLLGKVRFATVGTYTLMT